ncbi:hypothetical protein [Pradoshia sp.]
MSAFRWGKAKGAFCFVGRLVGGGHALPTYLPGKWCEDWEKGGPSVGKAAHIPPISQASGMENGKRVGQVWEKPRISHLSPRLVVRRVGKGWSKCGKSHAYPTYLPGKGYEEWEKVDPVW